MPLKYTPEQELVMYWSKVDQSGGEDACWIFKTSPKKMHGRVTWHGRTEDARRVGYLLAFGEFPTGMRIMLTCKSKACVNPKHMRLERQSDEALFWSRIDQSSGKDACWLWTAGRHRRGYGIMKWDGRDQKTHRIMWMITYGEIPDGLEVCHTCDNPPCCNPSHLFLGTHTDNIRDMVAKGRLFTPRGEQHGYSKFTDAKIAEMRRQHRQGDRPSDIAKQHDVSKGYIYYILNYRSRV